jgi:hypothetical protein
MGEISNLKSDKIAFSMKSIRTILDRLLTAIFHPVEEKKYPWLSRAWIGALFLAGALLWVFFFNWGDGPFQYHDWSEVWTTRQQAWRDALLKNTLPFHLNDVGAMRTDGDRYFTVADMVVSPQVILLRWLEVGPYTMVNSLLLYSIATWSLLRIRKRFGLSLFAYAVLFLLFHFNGFIVCHFSVGHLSWGGYYFFPAFVLLLLALLEGDHSWRWVTQMAFVLFFILLQGSFHHFFWCFLVLASLGITAWRHAIPLIKVAAATLMLSMLRILPIMSRIGDLHEDFHFLSGYPSLGHILVALTYNSTPNMAMPRTIFENNLGYWEFDIYIGWVGVAFLGIFSIFMLYDYFRERKFPYLILSVVMLVLFSIQDYFPRAFFNQTWLISSERVTTRMLGLVLVMLIILAAIYYQKAVDLTRLAWWLKLVQLTLLVVLAYDLVLHTLRWSVKSTYLAFGIGLRDLSLIHVSNHADPAYYSILAIGSGISLLTALFLLWVSGYLKSWGNSIKRLVEK